MAFNPSATDYGGMLDLRRLSDKQVTQALKAKGERDRAARIRKSGERSPLQKLGSAAVRGAAAYYTGGASESMGFGGAIDNVMLGTDSEGNPIQNEYGDLVKTGSAVYGAMKDRKAGDVAKKRATNIRDYEEQVRLAKEMGIIDPVAGVDMLTKAQDLRARQQAQTQKGEDASVWGWGGKFDDLEMSPEQIAGKEQADLRAGVTRKDAGMIPSHFEDKPVSDRKETAVGRQFDESQEMADATMGETQTEREDRIMRDRINKKFPEHQAELDKVEAMYERDRKQAFMDNPDLDSPRTPSTSLNEKFDKQRQMEDMMDREYNKRMSPIAGVTSDEFVSDYLGGGRKGTDDKYAPDWMTGKDKFKGSPMSKSYLEKAPKEDDYRSAMDKMADESDRRKRVLAAKEEWGGYKPDWARGKDEKQLLLEDRLLKEQALKREHERTGGPLRPKDIMGTKRYESALKKRLKKEQTERAQHYDRLKQLGGVLA